MIENITFGTFARRPEVDLAEVTRRSGYFGIAERSLGVRPSAEPIPAFQPTDAQGDDFPILKDGETSTRAQGQDLIASQPRISTYLL